MDPVCLDPVCLSVCPRSASNIRGSRKISKTYHSRQKLTSQLCFVVVLVVVLAVLVVVFVVFLVVMEVGAKPLLRLA